MLSKRLGGLVGTLLIPTALAGAEQAAESPTVELPSSWSV